MVVLYKNRNAWNWTVCAVVLVVKYFVNFIYPIKHTHDHTVYKYCNYLVRCTNNVASIWVSRYFWLFDYFYTWLLLWWKYYNIHTTFVVSFFLFGGRNLCSMVIFVTKGHFTFSTMLAAGCFISLWFSFLSWSLKTANYFAHPLLCVTVLYITLFFLQFEKTTYAVLSFIYPCF